MSVLSRTFLHQNCAGTGFQFHPQWPLQLFATPRNCAHRCLGGSFAASAPSAARPQVGFIPKTLKNTRLGPSGQFSFHQQGLRTRFLGRALPISSLRAKVKLAVNSLVSGFPETAWLPWYVTFGPFEMFEPCREVFRYSFAFWRILQGERRRLLFRNEAGASDTSAREGPGQSKLELSKNWHIQVLRVVEKKCKNMTVQHHLWDLELSTKKTRLKVWVGKQCKQCKYLRAAAQCRRPPERTAAST